MADLRMATVDGTPWDRAVRRDPHPFWRSAREQGAVLPVVGPATGITFHLVTTHAACVEVLRHPKLGHQPELHVPPDELTFPPDETSPFAVLGANMLFLDPPDHTRLRRLARDTFSKRTIDRLAPRVEAVTADLLDLMSAGDPFDLVETFSMPLPVTIIAELLGVPAEDQPRFRAWTKAILGSQFDEAAAAGLEFIGYLNELADDRRATPRDDLVTELIHAEDDGDRLSHTEFLAMVFLLLVAGHETTVNLLSNAVHALSSRPEERLRLSTTPEVVPTAVEELIRFCGPVETATMRFAYEDVDIAGHSIPRGAPVIPVLYAANRDPAVFEEPDDLVLDRDPNQHLGFGFGIHHCLGAPLARLEATTALTALYARFPDLTVTMPDDEIVWPDGFFLRGPAELIVEG